jgi:hypothetical protein
MNFSMNTRSSAKLERASLPAARKPPLLVVVRDAHALAAAAGRGLDHHGIADAARDLHRLAVVLDDAEMAGNDVDLRLLRQLLRFDLVAHGGDGLGRRPDEDDARLLERRREGTVLRQEAIAGMHGLGAGLAAGFHDLVDQEVAFGGGRRADQHGVIGHFDVERIAVGLGIDGDGLDPHPPRRFDNPAGDLAAICDQNSLEHVLLA